MGDHQRGYTVVKGQIGKTVIGMYRSGVSPEVGWYKMQSNIAGAVCAEKETFYVELSTFHGPFTRALTSTDPHPD